MLTRKILTIILFSFSIILSLLLSAPVFSQTCTDLDGDGYGNPGNVACPLGSKIDCDDSDANVYPGALKLCDGKDNNCDGITDFATDKDQDKDGVPLCGGDCDDINPARYPGNFEIYGTSKCSDGIDNDCNSKIDSGDRNCINPCTDNDHDGYGSPGSIYCSSGSAETDCNDFNASAYPGAPDTSCNNIDENCSGILDEGYVPAPSLCGAGDCLSEGRIICVNGRLTDTCVPGTPGSEGPGGDPSCSDGKDNNCNGTADAEDAACQSAICIDNDGDGYGINGSNLCPNGAAIDCDDNNAAANPGASDSNCDGTDNNCSGAADEGYVSSPTNCGIGACAVTGLLSCQNGTEVNTCAPGSPAVEGPAGTPACSDRIDNNCNGLVDANDAGCQVACVDIDGDGFGNPGNTSCPAGSGTDCNDADPNSYPGAPKICDGNDNNCDGLKDFGTDEDKDGDGVPVCAGDCDDNNANRYPGNYELFATPMCSDGIDNDCNFKTDSADRTCTSPCIDNDNDGYGNPGSAYCANGAETDCMDSNPSAHPGAPDNDCNTVDENCSGIPDDEFVPVPTSCGVGACVNTGQNICQGRVVVDTCQPLPAGAEGPFGDSSCFDGIDNNCNGNTDSADIFCTNVCMDSDGDGYGISGATVCPNGSAIDCDDADAAINPGASDTTCNGTDENCSGAADEGYVVTSTSCGTGACLRMGQLSCQSGTAVDSCSPGTPVMEGPLGSQTCSDNTDNNCNGLTDGNDPNCLVSCIDNDNDGYGNPGHASCPNGSKTDCDDSDANVYPGAAKICDGKDNNCDGITDFATDVDKDKDGFPVCLSDCNDNDAAVSPGKKEGPYGDLTCGDGKDNDCDLRTDSADTACAPPSCSTKTAPRNGPHMFDLLNKTDNAVILPSCNACHLDAAGNNVRKECQRCHADPSDTSNPLNGVLKQQYPLDPPYGYGTAPNVKTHGSSTLGTKYGNWGAACLTCHNPHLQEQDRKFETSYGKYIREYVCFDNTATSQHVEELVRFTSATGDGSFADGQPHKENICEMCHTRTNHHRIDGAAPGDKSQDGSYAAHYDRFDCMDCHSHSSGFKASCNKCHEGPPRTGTHLKHYAGNKESGEYGDTKIAKDINVNSSGYLFECGNCHPLDNTKHINGMPNSGGGIAEIEFFNATAPAGSIKAKHSPLASYTPGSAIFTDSRGFTYTQGTCSNIYCHSGPEYLTVGIISDPVAGTLPNTYPLKYNPSWESNVVSTRNYKYPVWGGAPFGCNGCHGYPVTSEYPAVSGGAGDSHAWFDDFGFLDLHAWNMGFDPVQCSTCHYNTVRDPFTWTRDDFGIELGNITIHSPASHVNGAGDVAFTPEQIVYQKEFSSVIYSLANTSYDPATKTCTNAACHQKQTSVKWGAPYRSWKGLECNICHRK